jgi:hypothetical protein
MSIDDKVSENLVAAVGNLSAIRLPAALPTTGKCLVYEALSFRVFSGKEQPADFRESLMGIHTVILKWRTRPQGELINDDALGSWEPKDHRADAAISKWRALQKRCCGLCKPVSGCNIVDFGFWLWLLHIVLQKALHWASWRIIPLY